MKRYQRRHVQRSRTLLKCIGIYVSLRKLKKSAKLTITRLMHETGTDKYYLKSSANFIYFYLEVFER